MKRNARIFRAAVFCASAAGLVWFLIPVYYHVLNVGNAAGLFVCAVLFLGSSCYGAIRRTCGRSLAFRSVYAAVAALFCLGAVWSAAMTACMAAGWKSTQPPGKATVIVLGSKVNGTSPSADLWARIGAASGYLKAHPDAVCIACGGQGPGESVPEASVIRDNLVHGGIESGRIFLEDTSTSTEENLENALKIVKEKKMAGTLAVVTDEYHEFRARAIAHSLGAAAYAVPAKTPWYILSACWAREVFALTKYFLIR